MTRDLPLISTVEAKELAMVDQELGWTGERMEDQSRHSCVGGEGQPKSGRLYSLFEQGSWS